MKISELGKQPKTIKILCGNCKAYDLVLIKDPAGLGTSFWIIIENDYTEGGIGAKADVRYALDIFFLGSEEVQCVDMCCRCHTIADVRSISPFAVRTEFGDYRYCLAAEGWMMQRLNIAEGAPAPASVSQAPADAAKRMQKESLPTAPRLFFSRDSLALFDPEGNGNESKISYPVEIRSVI